jgi:sulfotransferase family protein
MTLVEVLEVRCHESRADQLAGFAIDRPSPGARDDVYLLEVAGWVVGRVSPAIAVEFRLGRRLLRTEYLSHRRPDVASQFPAAPAAATAGFRTGLSVLGLPRELELELRAVLEDGSRVRLGLIRARHEPLRTDFEPRLQPLMVTSLGRTGTTWLLRLLAEHPRIVVQRDYPYETRVGRYWLHVLKVLAEPANPAESSSQAGFTRNAWWVGHNPYFGPAAWRHSETRAWLGHQQIRELGAFCQRSIDGFYLSLAATYQQRQPRYFAEKHLADAVPLLAWELYPRAREVFLVRDFRDMFASMLAFNAKRGYEAFGRQNVSSDADFLEPLRRAAQQLLRAWRVRAERAHLVRYEDLVEQPAGTLAALLRYLELDSSATTVDGLLARAGRPSAQLAEHRTSRDAASSVGRWRHDLAGPLRSAAENAFAEVLTGFGYALEGVTM